MSFLKSAALFAIDTVTKVDSPGAVAAVRGIIFEYAHHVSPDDQPAKKDFFKVIDHACKVVMDTQRLDHSAKFLVEMLHSLNVNVPDKLLNSSSTDYDQDVVVRALYDVANDKKDPLTLDRAFSAFLQIGTWSAYDHAIDLMGKQDEYAEKLIGQILHNAPDNKISLLENCMRVNRSAPVQKKVFAALCELSKSEDAIVAEDAQDVAVEMFYDRKEDGQYLNIADLAPVLEEVAKKTQSPKSLMPLFAKVTCPQNGLADFVEVRFLRKTQENSLKPDTTINLMAVFERIDRNNGDKGYPTPLSKIYAMLRSSASMKKEIGSVHTDLFGLDRA
ncbi:MAG: hypothetical protein A3J37_05515 [Alphaproteobacteria bacterium RIFCSPHIGHO2_12_FULL_45_9]|nr:MAG: hypothetical protein A3B66_01465 [Alphaproteobacteria bacterium RIFCSPHIGHO2_02_FULL_46_13]OFW93617.1 MAG: hypothetical protein A3J37_05515 [Alphaproteobacteria bacterium RIFCSPHIGHO2_12_FULL_45_9]